MKQSVYINGLGHLYLKDPSEEKLIKIKNGANLFAYAKLADCNVCADHLGYCEQCKNTGRYFPEQHFPLPPEYTVDISWVCDCFINDKSIVACPLCQGDTHKIAIVSLSESKTDNTSEPLSHSDKQGAEEIPRCREFRITKNYEDGTAEITHLEINGEKWVNQKQERERAIQECIDAFRDVYPFSIKGDIYVENLEKLKESSKR